MLVSTGVAGIAAAPADASTTTVQLGGVTARVRTDTTQVITVNHSTSWHARVTYWSRSAAGSWVQKRTTTAGATGYGGLVEASERRQWTGTTPLGTFALTEAFGNTAAPSGTALPFHRVRSGDYWVQDNRSAYYNTLRSSAQGGFRWWLAQSRKNSSERLAFYPSQYRWSVVIDFNRPKPLLRHGSGIFLHVNGSGATAGCVSAPRRFIRYAVRHLRPSAHPVIAIGR